MRLINADELYKRTAEWEEQAQDEVNKNKGCRTAEEWDKCRKWLIILNERSSFKYDIADAPTIDAEPVKHGYWKWNKQYGTECSECGTAMFEVIGHIFSSATPKYCPYCGARMDEVEE